MLQPYTKPALTYAEQLLKLQSNGMVISDEPAALRALANISYYRLSAYWHPFRLRNTQTNAALDAFEAGTRFEDAIALYEFDQQLRSLVLSAIEPIEVAVRTQFTYHLAHQHGAFGYTQAHHFHPQFNHADWVKKLAEETTRSKDAFILHYKSKYTNYPTLPIWMLTEVMSLGSLSQGYKGLRNDIKMTPSGEGNKQIIANHFGLHYKKLEAWLHTLSYVRNVCAHHSRLWNRELAIRPDQQKDCNWLPPLTPRNDRVFYVLLVLRNMLQSLGKADPWTAQMTQLLDPVCESKRWRSAMGVPDAWATHPLWVMVSNS
jgi:abortive infection bacteriophage resistance protein